MLEQVELVDHVALLAGEIVLCPRQQRVVVAACGPAALVNAARKAVAAARKECRGVRIEFAGGDSAW